MVKSGRVLKQFVVDFSSSCPLQSLLKIIGQGGREDKFYDFGDDGCDIQPCPGIL